MDSHTKQILFFTGAGSSSESGIPTFRKDNNALWNEHNVDDVCNINTFIKNKDLVFSFYNDMKQKYAHCKPNDFHYFLKEVQEQYLTKVFTSNIDTLLEEAGVKNVCHVHGSLNQMNCAYCYHSWPLEKTNETFTMNEVCPSCQRYKYTKPGVVFFGEKAPLYEKLYQDFHSDKDSHDFELNSKTKSLKIIVGASLNVITIMHLNISKYNTYEQSVLVDPLPSNENDFNIVISKKSSEAIPEMKKIIDKFMKS